MKVSPVVTEDVPVSEAGPVPLRNLSDTTDAELVGPVRVAICESPRVKLPTGLTGGMPGAYLVKLF